MKPKHTLRHVLASICCVAFTISGASAQTDGTWTQPDDGTYNWSDTGNWLDDMIANGTDATATFNVTPDGNQNADLDIPCTLGGISPVTTSPSMVRMR